MKDLDKEQKDQEHDSESLANYDERFFYPSGINMGEYPDHEY